MIVLIPGHDSKSQGARSPHLSYRPLSEYEYMYHLAHNICKELRERGLDCMVIDRSGLGILGAYEKARDELVARAIIELHFDMAPEERKGKAMGSSALYNESSESEMDLAKSILNAIERVSGIRSRGLKELTSEGESGFINVTAAGWDIDSVLIECFFGDNFSDTKAFDYNYWRMVPAISMAIVNWFRRYPSA